MSKGLSDAKTVRFILKRDYQLDFDEQFDNIEKDLDNITKFYNKIKEKRDNAKQNYLNERKAPIRNWRTHDEAKGQLDAYNDIVSLMESIFEVK